LPIGDLLAEELAALEGHGAIAVPLRACRYAKGPSHAGIRVLRLRHASSRRIGIRALIFWRMAQTIMYHFRSICISRLLIHD
jgi:hypothetical protein